MYKIKSSSFCVEELFLVFNFLNTKRNSSILPKEEEIEKRCV
jgi:hypothetical protein